MINLAEISKKLIIKINSAYCSKTSLLVIISLLLINFKGYTKTYTANLSGDYTDKNIWVPTYPGNIIGESDTIYINNNIILSNDVIVKGILMIKRNASLIGKRNLVILKTGTVINFGITIAAALNNQGMVYNKHILETSSDLINSGNLVNQESMIVGNILDNIGIITGNGGNLIANKRFINSQTGVVSGNIDVCSNNFMNVDGGKLDSTQLSFCGHRIFSNTYLSASIRKQSIVLNLKNSSLEDYKNYKVERSVDGINFETIANISKEEIEEDINSFSYTDKEFVTKNSVFYRLQLTTLDNKETYLPAVEVGKMSSEGKYF